jgi:hypothetical protein
MMINLYLNRLTSWRNAQQDRLSWSASGLGSRGLRAFTKQFSIPIHRKQEIKTRVLFLYLAGTGTAEKNG